MRATRECKPENHIFIVRFIGSIMKLVCRICGKVEYR